LLFSPKECQLLIKCLSAYLAEENLHTEFGGSVTQSAIDKLNTINAFTTFTQKELAAMCVALDFVDDLYTTGQLGTLSGFSNILPGGFYRLKQKTVKLYDEQKRRRSP
jgi:hypothetical protein